MNRNYLVALVMLIGAVFAMAALAQVSFFGAVPIICVLAAFVWLLAQRVSHPKVQYALNVIRKLVTVFVIVPALVFFLWLGGSGGFDSFAIANQLNQAAKMDTYKDTPIIKADDGTVIAGPPESEAEMIERTASGIRLTYVAGVFMGTMFLILRWLIVERTVRARSDTDNNSTAMQ